MNQNNDMNNQNYANVQNGQPIYQAEQFNNQGVNNEPPKKSYCGLLVVFMVISLLLAGLVVYECAFKEKETPENNCPPTSTESPKPSEACTPTSTEEEPKKEETSAQTTKDVKVVDAYTATDLNDPYKDAVIKIPKIDGNTQTILALNYKIMTDALSNISKYKDFMVNQMGEVENGKIKIAKDAEEDIVASFFDCYKLYYYKYETKKIGDVIIIQVLYELDPTHKYVSSSLNCWNASGSSANRNDFYFYDVANDKVLTFAEGAERVKAKFDSDSQCKKYTDINTMINKNYSVSGKFNANNDFVVRCADEM